MYILVLETDLISIIVCFLINTYNLAQVMKFNPVDPKRDFVALEKEVLEYWQKEGIVEKYLHKNDSSEKKFSFLDGPKTANNPLGVHHAWGRTYKDLWQRFYNMKGYKQRFQNGYDEQGLWVEVEVEKTLGLKSKKDIENIVPGDKVASLEKFITLCKERIAKYGDVITNQSQRLGQFMDWDNSYHTSSSQNNYMIWHFLKNVHQRGWLYKGFDSVPWCPRCGTAISQHEMQTEDYKEVTHKSLYVPYLIEGEKDSYLLIWTTTPWTLPANVAVVVDGEKDYVAVKDNGKLYFLSKTACERMGLKADCTIKGQELVGKKYSSPFDHLPRIQKALGDTGHQVVATDSLILPISDEEGTGLVHIAPGAGTEDFQLGKKLKLPIIEVIDEEAVYLDGMDQFSGKNAKNYPELVIDYLKEKGSLFHQENISHRYPGCWRCHSELVWRVVNEWYISVDTPDPKDGETFRQKMIKVVKQMTWQPDFVEKRELAWLENLHDWMISKKRYWGLAIPIWECRKCGNFEVIGGEAELKEKAIEGLSQFEGHSPHRPWIDHIKVKCSKCGEVIQRVFDVGNVWLDAGIVPYSTLTPVAGEVPSYITDKKYWSEWFPPDFAIEMYEQTRLWFYAMIAMSAALEEKPPVQRIFGHGRVVDEKGEEMHNSKGNAIILDEVFEKVGTDAMRWLFMSANPSSDVRFGYNLIDDVRKKFTLILWNSYKYFVDYATLASWSCELIPPDIREKLTVLDRWVLSRLTEVVLVVNEKLEKYDSASAARAIEEFVVNDLSTWYIRRSRGRVGPIADKDDEGIFLSTTYGVLVTLTKLLAPYMPFISESMFRNLIGEESVHLQDFPLGDKSLLDQKLVDDMKVVREIVEKGHALRKEANIKLRQPLSKLNYGSEFSKLSPELEQILADELNVKSVEFNSLTKNSQSITLDINITPQLQTEGEARELIRQIQQLRKDQGLTLTDQVRVTVVHKPDDQELERLILKQTNATVLTEGLELKVEVVNNE